MSIRPRTTRASTHRAGSTRRALRLLAAAGTALALAASATLGTGVPSAAFGGDTSAPPNYSYGCEVAPSIVNGNGDYGPVSHSYPTCSYFQTAPFDETSGAAPVPLGRVTLARVRSGANPAPIRITVVQGRTGLTPDGQPIQGSTQCCFGDQMTRTFRLRPNAVTTIPLNLPMENRKRVTEQVSITDYVGFSADSNVGTLPIRVTQDPPNTSQTLDPGNPSVMSFFPQVTPDQVRTDPRQVPSFLLTMDFTFCSSGSGSAGRQAARALARAGSGGACGGTVTTKKVTARQGKVRLPVRCHGSCQGTVQLKRAKGKGTLARTKRFSLRTGGKGTVTLRLTGAGKKATKGKRSVKAKVVLTAQGARRTRTVTVR
ncbi:MAG: hypothetical protein CMH83_22865 [Nocardioides sp.]|nr:hypothetical protein [Nocardioides sp.]